MDNICEFLCSKCGNIPEILKVHTDNNKIEFNCKCGMYEISIDDYYDELFKKDYYKNCANCTKKGLLNSQFYYCSNCKYYICKICKINHDSNHDCKLEKKKQDHYFFNRCKECKNEKIKNKYFFCIICKKTFCQECKDKKNCINREEHQYVDEKKKKCTCFEHEKEFKFYCFDCLENICEVCKNNIHINHNTKALEDLASSLNNDRNEIKKVNGELKNLVDLNEIILKYSDIFENNKDYLQSIVNIGKSLEEGNNRNSKDIKCLLKVLAQDIENSNKGIEGLRNHQSSVQLFRKEKYIHLNNRELDDDALKYISQIRFNQLKEIDISENGITNVEPFKKMILPFLEFLNLSHNKIKSIKPLSKLKSGKLQYLFLQNNEIEDIDSLSECDFPYLILLRAEDYNCQLKNKDEETRKKEEPKLAKIKNKLNEKFIYKSIDQQIKEFEDKYEVVISWESETIDLSDIKGGPKMLKQLFLIITYMPKNEIKTLSLRNNDIKDPSILNRINFDNLEMLDLAVNYIDDLKFLLDIKAKNLKYLYLDNNKFKEIYQILKAKLPNLEILSLNENNFNSVDMEVSPIYEELEQKEIEDENNPNKGKKIFIQLEKDDLELHKKIRKKKNANQDQQSNEQNPQGNNGNEEHNEEGQNKNHPEEANSNS